MLNRTAVAGRLVGIWEFERRRKKLAKRPRISNASMTEPKQTGLAAPLLDRPDEGYSIGTTRSNSFSAPSSRPSPQQVVPNLMIETDQTKSINEGQIAQSVDEIATAHVLVQLFDWLAPAPYPYIGIAVIAVVAVGHKAHRSCGRRRRGNACRWAPQRPPDTLRFHSRIPPMDQRGRYRAPACRLWSESHWRQRRRIGHRRPSYWLGESVYATSI